MFMLYASQICVVLVIIYFWTACKVVMGYVLRYVKDLLSKIY